MNLSRPGKLLVFAAIIIILLIVRVISYRSSLKQLGNLFSISERNLDISSENSKLLAEWIVIQNQLWLSDFSNFGSIVEKDSNSISDVKSKSNRKLVYWFKNSQSCNSCIDPIIDLIKAMADSIDLRSFLIISDFKSDRERSIFESKYQLYNMCFRFDPGKGAEMLNSSNCQNHLLFILDEDNRILFPAFMDLRFGISNLNFKSGLTYLSSK